MLKDAGRRKCCCGGKVFEKVDVTPAGGQTKRYFTRCQHCGLVISVSEDEAINSIGKKGRWSVLWQKVWKREAYR